MIVCPGCGQDHPLYDVLYHTPLPSGHMGPGQVAQLRRCEKDGVVTTYDVDYELVGSYRSGTTRRDES